jgi:hypothetical protein
MKSHNKNKPPVPDPLPPAGPPVAMDDEYEAFGLWMNVQLSQLVARWKHLAAPRAASTEFQLSKRFSAPRKAK